MKGFLLLNKPKGITSFKAVAEIKKLTKEKRVGHTGTLDPLATGVLPIFIGRPCVLANYILNNKKTYIAQFKFGLATDTLDITGKTVKTVLKTVKEQEILNVLPLFVGKSLQEPPMFSAKKINGKRLYDLARNGETVERKPCEIEIYSLKLLDFNFKEQTAKIEVECSKGTYIRVLISDIAKKMGTEAVLTELTRTASAGFLLEDSVELSKLTPENISEFILPEEKAVLKFKEITVSEKQAIRFFNGGELSLLRVNNKNLNLNEIIRVKYNGIFIGLGKVTEESVKSVCPLNNPVN